MSRNAKQIDDLCKAIWEMSKQAPHDFGGEQREFYLARLQTAMISAANLFPAQFARACGAESEIIEIQSIDRKTGAIAAKAPCTCHPDDNPPVPCPHKYALSDCIDAYNKANRSGGLGPMCPPSVPGPRGVS